MRTLEQLLAENARLRGYVMGQAICSCCGEAEDCSPDCTMNEDNPEWADVRDAARSLLSDLEAKK